MPSIIKENNASNDDIVDEYYVYFIRLFFVISLTFTLIFIYFSNYIVFFLIGNSNDVISFILIISSAPFLVVYSIGDAFLKSYGKFTQLVLISITSSVISILLLYPLLKYYGIVGVSIYLLLSGLIVFTIYILFNWSKIKLVFKRNKYPKLSYKTKIVKIGIVSLFSSFLFIGSNIILRKFTIDNLGLFENGIYQSVASLSASSFLVVYNYLNTYLLPKISGTKNDDEIKNEIDENFRFILLLMVPTTIAIFSFRSLIIQVLFSPGFISAVDIIQYQFLGDFFRGLSGLFGIWMVFKMKIKFIMMFDLIMNVSLVLFPYICKYWFNIVSIKVIPISYMIALGLHFILFLSYTIYNIKYRISKNTLKTVIISITLLILAFSTDYLNTLLQYIVSSILIFIYWFIAVTSEEKIKLLSLSKKYYLLLSVKFKRK